MNLPVLPISGVQTSFQFEIFQRLHFVFHSSTEIDNDILQALMDIVHQLVSQGELMLAKILRRKVLEKVEQKKQMQLDNTHHLTLWESHHMTTK